MIEKRFDPTESTSRNLPSSISNAIVNVLLIDVIKLVDSDFCFTNIVLLNSVCAKYKFFSLGGLLPSHE